MNDTEPLVTGQATSVSATILVIDAQLLASSALAYALRDQGFDAHPIRADLAEVEAAALAHRPGLVLLDLDRGSATGGHPLDGVNLTGLLRAHGWTVMALTDETNPERIAHALVQGAVTWISKGSSFAKLVQATVEIIQVREQLPPPDHAAPIVCRTVRA